MESSNKVALVTGAASGIGKATARAFVATGYVTVAADVNAHEGDAAARELGGEAGGCHFLRCDVADPASVRTLFAQIDSRFGRIDAAFNNAGVEGLQAPTDECTLDNWDRVMGINLRGLFLCMQEEIRRMLCQKEGGAIVNCASVAGLVGLPGIPAYTAAKHGVVGLTRSAALEYATRKIRVNAVCPGAIETPMLQRFMGESAGAREAMLATEPVGRIGTPDEIANAVVWLCSEKASFIVGQPVAVDGGWTAR